MDTEKNTNSIKVMAAVLAFSLIFMAMPVRTVAASNGSIPLSIDVWTNKGGKGLGTSGGSYKVGEETTIYVKATAACRAKWVLTGPSISNSEEMLLQGEGTYEWSPGQAAEVDIGQWQVTFEAWTDGQYASDRTSFTVVAAQADSEIVPTPPSSVVEDQPATTIDAVEATELYALMALKMAEGSLAVDLSMDADGDRQLTREDARLILQWAAKKPDNVLLTPQQETKEVTGGEVHITANEQLLGKWEMDRVDIQLGIPDSVPDFVVNWFIDKKATWEITSDNSGLKINYNGRDTWYKKTFLGGLTEGPTTVSCEGENGLPCAFRTQTSFHLKSLGPLSFLSDSKIKQIEGVFTSNIHVSLSSGNKLEATITIGDVNGTYYSENGDGQMKQKPINFEGGKIIYAGIKK